MRFFWGGLIIGFASLFQISCTQAEQQSGVSDSTEETILPDTLPLSKLLQDTVLKIGAHEVEIRLPAGRPLADLVLLPGWNFNRNRWCDDSPICARALELGYRLILPEMGKSMYALQVYPETSPDLKAAPTRTWFNDTLLPRLQTEYNLLRPHAPSFIVGLSTGGRGVALLLMDNPTLFRAGAALSGDYNLPSMPAERINIAMYGPLSQHPERWKGPENPMDRLRDLKTPLYLGHGALDNVVEAAQTQKFYEALRALQPQLPLELHIEGDAGHDFSYWASETDSVLRFFERYR